MTPSRDAAGQVEEVLSTSPANGDRVVVIAVLMAMVMGL